MQATPPFKTTLPHPMSSQEAPDQPVSSQPTPPSDASHKSFLTSTFGVFVLALISTFLWGSAFPSIKIGYQLFSIAQTDMASQMLFAGARFTLAGMGVIICMSLVRRQPLTLNKRSIPSALLLALFQTTLQYIFFYLGLSYASGVTSSIISAAGTFFCILLSALVFKLEHLTARKLLGCAIGFAGVALVSMGQGGHVTFSLLGEGSILISTLAGAIAACLIQIFSHQGEDPVALSGWQFLAGGITLIICGIALGGKLQPTSFWAHVLIAYMAFISAAAYSIWSVLLAHNPVSRVTIFGFFNPVFGTILSVCLLGEAGLISPAILIASLILASLGIIVVNKAPARG